MPGGGPGPRGRRRKRETMTGAAIFDVDGTLTDTNHLHVVAW